MVENIKKHLQDILDAIVEIDAFLRTDLKDSILFIKTSV